MNSRRSMLIVALLLVAGFIGAAVSSRFSALPSAQAETASKDANLVKWENNVLVGNSSVGDIQGRINNLGEEGWEVSDVVYEQSTNRYIVFLKRPKR